MSQTTATVTSATRPYQQAPRPLGEEIRYVDARVQAVDDQNFALALEFATEMGATLQMTKEEKEGLIAENNLLEQQIVQLNIAHKKECKALVRSTKAEVQALSDKIDTLIQRLEHFKHTHQDKYHHFERLCLSRFSVDAFVDFRKKYPDLPLNDLYKLAGEVVAAERTFDNLEAWQNELVKFPINSDKMPSPSVKKEKREKTFAVVETPSQEPATDTACSVFERYKLTMFQKISVMEQENALIRADNEGLQLEKEGMQEKHRSSMKDFRRHVFYHNLNYSITYGQACRDIILDEIKPKSDEISKSKNELRIAYLSGFIAKSHQITRQIDAINGQIEEMAKEFKPEPGERGKCLIQ